MFTSKVFFDRKDVIEKAEKALEVPPMHITDRVASASEGTIHDYYSNGIYWWPDPTKPDGLPYIRRDGEFNPDNFNCHRDIMAKMKDTVVCLAAGYKYTGEEKYAERAVRILREFFLDEATYMAPHLSYAQAIPGICSGRGIGLIDTLQLVEIPFAAKVLEKSPAMTDEIYQGLKRWFGDYVEWMNTHPYGIAERDYKNNHAVCWHVQALSFAGFADRRDIIDECVWRYKNVILPHQMRTDGAFYDELTRTKPYSYSIFVLDAAVSLVQLASMYGYDLWDFALPDGRSIRRGLDFLLPYLEDKSKWFLPPDVEDFDELPSRTSFMLFAALHYQDERYKDLYLRLKPAKVGEKERALTSYCRTVLIV